MPPIVYNPKALIKNECAGERKHVTIDRTTMRVQLTPQLSSVEEDTAHRACAEIGAKKAHDQTRP